MSALGLALFVVVIYFMYWAFKTASYEIFYESMVEGTIREMVREESLKLAE